MVHCSGQLFHINGSQKNLYTLTLFGPNKFTMNTLLHINQTITLGFIHLRSICQVPSGIMRIAWSKFRMFTALVQSPASSLGQASTRIDYGVDLCSIAQLQQIRSPLDHGLFTHNHDISYIREGPNYHLSHKLQKLTASAVENNVDVKP